MNLSFASILLVIEESFSYLKARFTVARKAFYENLYEVVSEKLTGYNCYDCKSYNCFSDLFFDFKESLQIFN